MLVILVLLPVLILLALFVKRNIEWRLAVLYTSIFWSMFVALDTELLSAFQCISRGAVAVSWVVFSAGAVLALLVSTRAPRPAPTINGFTPVAVSQSVGERILLLGMIGLVILVGVCAVAAAPNTWDAMLYHLPRVFEWMNNGSVGLYPTPDHQQLSMPPWSEYAMLHLDILSGGDTLVDLVQWSCYLGSILVTSLIAKELGAGRETQLLAAILCATIPSAVLGASGPKNDSSLAYWVIASAYFLIVWRRDYRWAIAAALGATMSLAVFTKGTAYTYLPFLILTSFFCWEARARRRFLLALPLLGVIAVLVIAPFYYRNYLLSGSILGTRYFDGLGPIEGRIYSNTPMSVMATIANLIRNMSLHLGFPSGQVNQWTTHFLSQILTAIGVDPDDPRQTVASQLGYHPPFAVQYGWKQEVLAGEPLHLAAFALAAIIALFSFRKLDRRISMLGLSVIGGYLLLCVALRWGPWSARYQLALFVLAAPFTALVIARTISAPAVKVVPWVLLLAAAPLAVLNLSRPLLTKHGINGGILTVPRDETYFWDQNREIAPAFLAAARYAASSSCRSIGVDAEMLRFDYPMMALIASDHVTRNITYSGVVNDTTRFALRNRPAQCMVICLGCANAPEKWRAYGTPADLVRTFDNRIAVLPVASAP